MPTLTLIADDLTGTFDASVPFAAAGVSVVTSFDAGVRSAGAQGRQDAAVLAINADSRHLDSYNAFLRYVFRSSFPPSEEWARFLFIYITFFGAIEAFIHHKHIAVDLLVGATSGKVRKTLNVLASVLALFALGLLLYGVHIAALPDALYQNYLTAYLGFPHPGFYTTDYFSLLPWLFLFLAGFYVYQMAGQRILKISWPGIPPLNWIGRHALEIYVVHQPVIYGLIWLGSRVGGR